MDSVKSWMPTRKWFAAFWTGMLLIVGHALVSGAWDVTEWGELVTLMSGLGVAYLVPNADTPGGVPTVGVVDHEVTDMSVFNLPHDEEEFSGTPPDSAVRPDHVV